MLSFRIFLYIFLPNCRLGHCSCTVKGNGETNLVEAPVSVCKEKILKVTKKIQKSINQYQS